MDLLKIFQRHSKAQTPETKTNSGGTGVVPAIGKQPGIPALPKTDAPSNLPKIKKPSLESAQASKKILNPNSEKPD